MMNRLYNQMLKHVIYGVYCMSALFAAPVVAFAQNPGDMDLSFNNQGYISDDFGPLDTFHKVLVQPDQKILAAGMSWNEAYVAKVVVTRFLPTGILDLSFGASGTFEYNLDIEALAYDAILTPEGKIIIAGSTTDYSKYRILLIQINSDGTLDTDFGDNGVVTSAIGLVETNGEDMSYGIDLDASGNILVCGSSFDENYNRRPVVVRYKPEGVLDTNFGVNGVASLPAFFGENVFDCLVVQADGKVVAAGHYAEDLLYFVLLVTRFNADGSLDTTFGEEGVIKYSYNNVDDEAYSLAIRPNGKILVGGFSASQNYTYNSLLMQFTESGVPDSSFGENGLVVLDNGDFDVIEDIKILPDGGIVAAGTSGEGPPNAFHLAIWKYMPDGSPDNEFGTNGFVQHEVDAYYVMLHSMAFQEDGKLILAGQARFEANNDFFVCRVFMESPNMIHEEVENPIGIFPNPSNGSTRIQIEYDSSRKWETVMLYSLTGQLLYTGQLNNMSQSFDLPAELPQGLYLLRVENKLKQSSSQKLLITSN